MKTNIETSLELLEEVVITAETVEFYRGRNQEAFNKELDVLKEDVRKWREFCKDKSYPARISDCKKMYYYDSNEPLKVGDYVDTSLGRGRITKIDYNENFCKIEPTAYILCDDDED